MFTGKIAVICRINDNSLLKNALGFQLFENAPDLLINQRDQPVVMGDTLLQMCPISGPERIGKLPPFGLLLAFGLALKRIRCIIRHRDLLGIVHAIKRRGHSKRVVWS